jgi:hypothetical protein
MPDDFSSNPQCAAQSLSDASSIAHPLRAASLALDLELHDFAFELIESPEAENRFQCADAKLLRQSSQCFVRQKAIGDVAIRESAAAATIAESLMRTPW